MTARCGVSPRRICGDRSQHLQPRGLIRPIGRAAAFAAILICFPAVQHNCTHPEGASISTTSTVPIAPVASAYTAVISATLIK